MINRAALVRGEDEVNLAVISLNGVRVAIVTPLSFNQVTPDGIRLISIRRKGSSQRITFTQAVVEDQFIISVRNETKNRTIYVSEPGGSEKMSQVKPLWLLPDYKIGIIYKGRTIKQLVRERAYLNFALILLLDILLVAGVWFVFRSFSAEIKLSQMRADFISNVSHELRTPLALMSVYIETILLGRVKNEKLTEYYNVIHQETNRLTNIINKILNFSRLEEKKYKFVFQRVDLNQVIEKSLQRFEYHFKNQNFEISINFEKNIPAINGDEEALFELFLNLIDNAIKYSKDEKFIGVETGFDKNRVWVHFTDKGIGIPENDQKYIFDKFFRVIDGEKQGVRGSGLGLSIVKNIMESHSGSISLASEHGKGTTFQLVFPISIEQNLRNIKAL